MDNTTKTKRHTYSVKSPSRGGYRPGGGRPKGSSNKVKLEDLLANIEARTGVNYAEQLATNYAEAIIREDWKMVNDYDKAFLNKVVADKQEIEVTNINDDVQAKAQVFADALQDLARISNKQKESK
jgi:hypothetical protein